MAAKDYARSLMAEEDWYRAISELKRHRFFGGANDDAEVDRLIGLCYLHADQHFDAYKWFGKVLDNPSAGDALRASAAWRRMQSAHLGGASLLVGRSGPRLFEEFRELPVGPPIGYLRAYNLLQFARWNDAALVFEAVASADPDGDVGRSAAGLAVDLSGSPRFHPKSPALAGFLAVMPGLGHVYAERYDDALNALMPNAVLLASTGLLAGSAHSGGLSYVWPAMVGTLALAFYSANIYSAVNVTRQGNQLIVANEVAWYRKRSIIGRLETLDLEPAPGAPP